MNPEFEVLGIGRTPMSSEEFRKKTGEAAAKSKDTRDFSESGWTDFETRLNLSFAKMLSSLNAFVISNIQKQETE